MRKKSGWQRSTSFEKEKAFKDDRHALDRRIYMRNWTAKVFRFDSRGCTCLKSDHSLQTLWRIAVSCVSCSLSHRLTLGLCEGKRAKMAEKRETFAQRHASGTSKRNRITTVRRHKDTLHTHTNEASVWWQLVSWRKGDGHYCHLHHHDQNHMITPKSLSH